MFKILTNVRVRERVIFLKIQSSCISIFLKLLGDPIKVFFAIVCAQSYYRFSPIGGVKSLYTIGPHGFLSCFITDVVPGIFWFFKLQAGPSVTPLNE